MWVERICDHPEFVLPVAANMREWDKREIYANRWDDDPEGVARDAVAMGQSVGWVAGLDDRPIAAFGCFQMWPGVWSMWLFATDDFRQIRFSMTKLIVRNIIPMLWEAGAHRLQCHSMDGHDDAQDWLKVIGARRESTCPGYGRNGEAFHCYVWEKR